MLRGIVEFEIRRSEGLRTEGHEDKPLIREVRIMSMPFETCKVANRSMALCFVCVARTGGKTHHIGELVDA